MKNQWIAMAFSGLVFMHGIACGWTSPLYPAQWLPSTSADFYSDAFLQDFSYAGYRKGEVAIPRVSGLILDVTKAPFLADPTGTADATVAIQKALDSAGNSGGGVVYLPAATFKISVLTGNHALAIKSSGVVLRGAGPGQTFLRNTTTAMNSKSILKTIPGGSSWNTVPAASGRTAISRDLRNPTKVIPVASTTLFKTGDWVIVRNRITEAWVAEHNEPGWVGFASQLPGFLYCRQVTAVDAVAKTITIDAPIRYSLLTRDSSMVYLAPKMMEEVGVENLSIGNDQITTAIGWGEEDYTTVGNAGYDAHASYAISFDRVRNGWIRNVKSYAPAGNSSSGTHILSNGVLLNQTRGVTIDSCDFRNGQYGGGGGNGYMYRVSGNENLIRDSKATFARHGFVLSHMQASGNVFLRVYDKDGGKQTGLTGTATTSGKGSDHHMHFSHANLFDQCISENSNFQAAYRPYGSDPMHNLTSSQSVYWNTTGLGAGAGSNYLIITQQARYGFVIGTQGTRNTVNRSATGDVLTKTAPLDSVEGIGQGATLSPQSLYADQLSKRLLSLPVAMQPSNPVQHQKQPKRQDLGVFDLLGRSWQ